MSLDDRLARAAERGDTAEVLRLLGEMGGTAELTDHLALIWAAGSNQMDTLRAVVEHGADIHRPGGRGHLAVCVAAYQGALDALMYLVEIGGDASRADCRGTPLLQAKRMRRAAVVEYLESMGVKE